MSPGNLGHSRFTLVASSRGSGIAPAYAAVAILLFEAALGGVHLGRRARYTGVSAALCQPCQGLGQLIAVLYSRLRSRRPLLAHTLHSRKFEYSSIISAIILFVLAALFINHSHLVVRGFGVLGLWG